MSLLVSYLEIEHHLCISFLLLLLNKSAHGDISHILSDIN